MSKDRCNCGNPLSVYNESGVCNACKTKSNPPKHGLFLPNVPMEKRVDFSAQVHKSQYHR